jgi:RNA polymerase sigma factor (sigma-70 family)
MEDPFNKLMSDKPKGQKIVQTVKDYSNRLFGFIRGKVKSDEDAEDILQDVWYQLSNAINISEIEQMSAWLFQVARNKIIDKHRRKTPELLDDLTNEEAASDFKNILLVDDTNPETEFLKEVFWQELFTALDELPEDQRQVFIWNELENLTLQQIADKTGEKLKTVISRKGYAVRHLRQRLETVYAEFINL